MCGSHHWSTTATWLLVDDASIHNRTALLEFRFIQRSCTTDTREDQANGDSYRTH